jgi:hypothetical protein
MSQPIIHFRSSIVQITLTLDSRGYILFSLSKLNPDSTDKFSPLSSMDALTCEYLPDLVLASYKAMEWIGLNCEEEKNGQQHLYFRLRTPQEQALLSARRNLRLSKRRGLRGVWSALFRPRSRS